jgi:hypothetical protein
VSSAPPAAVAIVEAGLDDYRTLTPPEQQTPHGAALLAIEYLLSSGYAIRPDLEEAA